jgi:hypothetical protein
MVSVFSILRARVWLPILFVALHFSLAHGQTSARPAASLSLAPGEQIIDYDTSLDGAYARLVVRSAERTYLRHWQFASNKISTIAVPSDISVQAIATHPADNALVMITRSSAGLYRIERMRATETQWKTQILHETPSALRRLLVSSAKVGASYLQNGSARAAHRIYFAAQGATGAWTVHSVRDDGSLRYTLMGADIEALAQDASFNQAPFQMRQGSTLPASMHPSGLAMLVQNDKACFQKLVYDTNDWASNNDSSTGICGGFLSWTRNGLFLQHWKKDIPGVVMYSTLGGEPRSLLSNVQFAAPPTSMPDGKHLLVHVIDSNKQQSLQLYPVAIPAGDIANAWMFSNDGNDIEMFDRHGGLFRSFQTPDGINPEMYRLYDTENYLCGAGTAFPKRPYLVTTDLLWENVAAAYEGAFILHERHFVMPRLDALLSAAIEHYATRPNPSRLALALLSAAVVRDKAYLSRLPSAQRAVIQAEVKLINQAAGLQMSPVWHETLNYAEFMPRGHYSGNPDTASYFQAVRLLSTLKLNAADRAELAALPRPMTDAAVAWANAYSAFVAESRSTLAWAPKQIRGASYARELDNEPRLFPLAWGFDNEVFHNTTYRSSWPRNLQVSPEAPRTLPSGLDIAAVLGSDLAVTLLQPEMQRYPGLAARINDLRKQASSATQPSANLYHAWIHALASEFTAPPDNLPAESNELWQTKRLQTGLASWATLRHATILVNEKTGAEGGQGGFSFETVVHAPPRGAVEPDPVAFQNIADLMDRIAAGTAQSSVQWPSRPDIRDMTKAYIDRVKKAAALARELADMAQLQAAGKPLTASQYAAIENIGGAAEHDFLLFKSVQVPDGALNEPDPISKIADVAKFGSQQLLAAVGQPLEWNQSVGKPGARQLMRGSIYSYFEFVSAQPMTDETWRQREKATPRPAWVSRYFVNKPLACTSIR